MDNAESVDVVVVGSGAAGSCYAARLAAAGKRVRVLEAGPKRQISDLYSSQIWARRLKWGGAPVELAGRDRIAHNSITGWGSGGAALVHYGTWPRLSEEAFKLRSLFGVAHDWPFDYAELRPWYDRIQEEVGISGDAEQETWRPPGQPYPMPPLRSFRHGELLKRGFDALGLPTAPLPLAINSRSYQGRPPCTYDGWCDAGCPLGALANPLVTYLHQAVRHGAEVTEGAEVTRVRVGADGLANGVEYVERGATKFQPAALVVLAASVFQNPRILLNSATESHPAGLANSSGLVGRYLFGEGMVGAYGLFDEPTQCHKGVNAGQFTYREGFRHESRPGIQGGLQWQIGGAVKPSDLYGIAVSRTDLFGDALHEFLRDATAHFAFMVGFCGGVPSADNRVMLSSREDRNGMPLARVEHAFTEGLLAMRAYLQRQGARVVEAAGAREVWTTTPAVGHVTGGTIMGDDPRASVVDGYGCCHDVPNLVLAGAGIFPTATGTSPTYTLMAVSARSADRLAAEL